MLGKLMKYEWRGLRTPLIIMLCILAGTTILTCAIILTINPKYDDVTFGLSTISALLSFLLYYLGVIGCSVGTMLIIAIRFYKTCYTDQGYLTHTLPVTTVELVASKTITAILNYLLIIFCIVITAIVIISVFGAHIIDISGLDGLTYKEFSDFLPEINREFRHEFGISLSGYINFMLVTVLIEGICGIITVLGCVSLGQLYTKHRVIGAIIAYFAVSILKAIIGYISALFMYTRIIHAAMSNESIPMFHVTSPSAIISLIVSIAIAVAMHFINLHMMTKRLNLE